MTTATIKAILQESSKQAVWSLMQLGNEISLFHKTQFTLLLCGTNLVNARFTFQDPDLSGLMADEVAWLLNNFLPNTASVVSDNNNFSGRLVIHNTLFVNQFMVLVTERYQRFG